ncbi:MAG TPA: tripartite tricarboxylate transporter substrate binding protein [Candidatus Sulfotelmatobacter sp.]|nr:tripartite tricarboxylate transporter substrate binding protein [Candidatus Sulfotelmatobacter sp.]
MKRIALPILLLLGLALPAAAADWPTRPVHVIVPYPPGGPADALGRLFAPKLEVAWGQPIVIENRGGASGSIGARVVAKAAPDGYTLLLHSAAVVINVALTSDPGYDPFTELTPISEIASYMLVVVVHPSVKATSLAELVALAKAHPGEITFGSAGGAGSPTHLAAELFKRAAGIDILHVPYTGAAPATTALLAGQVNMMFDNPLSALPQIKAGSLRALAVTGEQRMALAPELPTVAELGYPGFEARTWYGISGPAHLPPAILAKANQAIVAAAHDPDVHAKLAAQGLDAYGTSPEELAALFRSDLDRWGALIKEANIHAD